MLASNMEKYNLFLDQYITPPSESLSYVWPQQLANGSSSQHLVYASDE
jgi:hypothetical protein